MRSLSEPPSAPASSRDHVPLLLARATFGYTPAEARRVRELGHDAWLDEQLRPESIDDSALESKLARWPWLQSGFHYTVETTDFDPEVMRSEFKGIGILCAAESKRQLFERAVDYWSNHFSVYIGALARVFEDDSTWRAHVFGRFEDLLIAVVRSTTMIFYLDNQSNVAGVANENLAREILELFTLGAHGPYGENDVREFARALTGWTYDDEKDSPNYGGYKFDESMHDRGPKEILGMSFPAGGGDQDVVDVLRHLAARPETVDFVVRRMARWFLGEDVPASVIDEAKGAWSDSAGELREVMRALFSQESIAAVAATGRTRFRRPMEWLVAVYRGTGATFPDPAQAHRFAQRLGQAPHEWYAPDGYPDNRGSWVGLIEPRWATASEILRDGPKGDRSVADTLSSVVGDADPSEWVAKLDEHCTGGRLSRVDRREIQRYVDGAPGSTPRDVLLTDACELVLTCPSFHEI